MTGEAILMLEDNISAQLLRGFTDLTKEVAGLKGVILTRMDDTERRVGKLEESMTTLVGDTISYETMAPKAFDEIARLESACHDRHTRLNNVLASIEKTESATRLRQAHADGVRAGRAKSLALFGGGLTAVISFGMWAWEHWFSKWFAGGPK